jgi:predicted metal-dependent peptidase
MTAMDRVSQAKSLLLMDQVFFATLIMGTKIIETETLPGGDPNPTAATDMKNIYYNPKFILGLPDVDMVKFVLAHEVMHIAMMHTLRIGGRDPDKWNIACDYAINWMLKKAKFSIWPKAYCDAKYDGMSAEQIYDLRKQEKDDGGGGGGDPLGGDLIKAHEALDPVERAQIEQHVRRMVADAATQARLQGSLPGFLERFVDGLVAPPLPWERLLEDFAHRVVDRDLNWSRRNRRFPHIYLPSRRSEAMGELIIIGDTSGSMPDRIFKQTGAEMKYIVEIVKPERIRVLWADDEECSLMEVFEPEDEIKLHPKGGGGTDMRLPLKYAETFDPVCVVLVTDCMTPWPDRPPPYPLITVSSTRGKCPYGTTVHFSGVVQG